MKRNLLLILALAVPTLLSAAQVNVTKPRTEQMKDPMGLETAAPHLGWQIESDGRNIVQKAYRILVASSPELLDADNGDLWDSGKVESAETQWIPYEGTPLESNERAWWKVMSYTNAGQTEWSEPAFFSIGLRKNSQWQGIWIGMERTSPWDEISAHSRLSSRYLRKEFTLDKAVSRATVYIAGLGLYELYINGSRVGDQVLAPVPTDYRKTVVYNTFDVTDLLSSDNAVAVTLGNGHYFTKQQDINNADGRYKVVNFGFPKLRLNLIVEYADGTTETIATDRSWKLNPDGPIRSCNEYDGETYDARKEFGAWTEPGYDDSSWRNAEVADIPTGTLRGTMTPNMKVVGTITPVSIRPQGDKYIMDMGQNFTGWLRIKVRGAEGDTLTLRFAETLQESGELYTDNLRTARQTDRYICNGHDSGTEWAPRFVYHGFRYVEISGYDDPQLSDFIGEIVTDEMEVLGSFETSNKTLNSIYHNCFWGIMSDYKGFPVDCPQRDEREPWLGDRGMGAWGECYVVGNEPLYSKWTRDICEAQREDGCIPDVAPAFWYFYTDNVTWPYALPSVCDMLYTQYGDTQAIERSYPHIRLWIRHLMDEYMTEDWILTKDTYGDWCVPPESLNLVHSKDPARRTEGDVLSTAYMVKVSQIMRRFAEILGLQDDAEEYRTLERNFKDGFNAKYLHVEGDRAWYANNTVTANILPLAFGIVPEQYEDAVAESLLNTVEVTYDGHVSCGVIGIQWLLTELTRRGRGDIAWKIATDTTYPSWGYMVEQGATTVWELWNGNTAEPSMNSGNHVMLIGDLVVWCYQTVGGIRPDRTPGRTGFRHIILEPDFTIDDAEWANVSYDSIYGKIVSNWKKTRKEIVWDVTVPANTTAEVHLPDGRVELVGSGSYSYTVKR